MPRLAPLRRRHTHPGPVHPHQPEPSAAGLVMRADGGELLPAHPARWHGAATAEEQELLAPLAGPVIDLGCGPGRLVISLARRRVPALGIDSSAAAVAVARSRGAAVLERDLFTRLPGEGRWASLLLFDGNVGIGGDPSRLLARCRRLVRPGGRLVVEVEPPGTGLRRMGARLERGTRTGPSFPWAVVGADAIGQPAQSAGLAVERLDQTPTGRWFAHLQEGRG